MAQKFMIFANIEESVIVLDNVGFHREIKAPEGYRCRCGGGFWNLRKDGTLTLSDESFDFGKYDIELAQEAFEAKRITLSNEMTFDELGIKKLVTM